MSYSGEVLPEGPPERLATKNGFLLLTETDNLKPLWVKGSSIVCVQFWKGETHSGSMVWFDSAVNHPMKIVRESVHEILDAIAESYKQARSR